MDDLAIVLVNYNTREHLRACLDSLAVGRGALACRVVVVDNASHDGSADMVRADYPWVELVAAERNDGYASGNNLALRRLGFGEPSDAQPATRHVLLLNPDTLLPSDALPRLVAYLDANPDVGVVGPRLVRPDGSLDRACRRAFPTLEVSFYRLSGLSRLFPKSRRFGRYNLTYLPEDALADVDAVVGAFMLMRSEALAQAGLLDEAFFMYGEDLDLCYRIKALGWRVVYNPEVTVLHVKGAASRQASQRAISAFYQAMRIFHNKHYRQQSSPLANWLVDAVVPLLGRVALWRDCLRPAGRKRVASA